MAGVSIQGSKSDEPPAYSSVNTADNTKDPELRWYLEVFQNENGETFAQLFDIFMRRNDMVEEHVHQQIRALPASGRERKTQLAIAMMELRLEQVWLQSQKETYLAYPDEREPIREGVLLKVMGIIKSRNIARRYFAAEQHMESADCPQLGNKFDSEMLQAPLQAYQRDNPSTPLGEIRWHELKQEYAEEVQWREQQDAYWRVKAEVARSAAEGKRVEDQANREKKYAEDAAKWHKKYEEESARLQQQYEEESVRWQKQIDDNTAKWQMEFEEEQAKWQKQAIEEHAKYQKKVADDMARWQKQDAEYLAKWQKKDAEALARQRIKNAEDFAKSRTKEAQDRAWSRAQEAADRVGSPSGGSFKTKE
ncbi:hypothetical protein BGZ82_010205 [Podila clonocystis]|nr:hypothetical protein BGZ82_010205 [Podila clonocystis]